MRKYILIGALAFLAFAVALAPASVVRLATGRVPGLELRTVGGTVWNGEARPVYRGEPQGRLAWTFAPSGILDGEARLQWRLSDLDLDLSGDAAQGFGDARATIAGRVGAPAVNRVLGRYDIGVDGDFELHEVSVASNGADGLRLSGQFAWKGGRTFYRLSGLNYDTTMPAMTADLETVDGEHAFDVRLADDALLLIRARLDAEGWIEVGLTRRFVALAGIPWPVPGEEDAIVLTVEEQLFR